MAVRMLTQDGKTVMVPGAGKFQVPIIEQSKQIMSRALLKNGFSHPAFHQATGFEEACEKTKELSFPQIVKQPDSNAARGVVKVSDFEELAPKFQDSFACFASWVVLSEEFFGGKKLELMGFTSDFEFIN